MCKDSIAATANTISMDFREIIKIVGIHLDNRKKKLKPHLQKYSAEYENPDFLTHRIRFFQCYKFTLAL